MTITWQTPGAAGYSASGGTSVSVAYPASSSEGEKLILIIGQKPSTANGGTVTTPGSWNLVTSITGAGGYGTTLGNDTGNTNLFVYERTVPVGGLSGSLSVTVGTNGVCWGFMSRLTHSAGFIWDSVAGATGEDTSGGNVSIAFTSDPSVTANDFIIGAMCIPTDISTPTQFSAENFSQSGISDFGTVTEINEPDTGTGSDIGGFSCRALVVTGTSTGNPTMTATAGGTTTNVRGPGVFIRIRELDNSKTLTGNNCNQPNATTTGAITQAHNVQANNCNQPNSSTTGAIDNYEARYWVGGSGNWDASSTTHWSATPGGSSGASVPTSVSNVYFDGSSDSGATFTVTVTATANCRNLLVSGLDQSMVLAGSSQVNVYGDLEFPATGLSVTKTNYFAFKATNTGHTVNTNGISISSDIAFNGVGGEWTLVNNLICDYLNILSGSFISANKTITCNSFISDSGLTRSIALGSSIIYTGNATKPVDIGSETGLTLDAGTSRIEINAANNLLYFGTKAWYDIKLTKASGSTFNTSIQTSITCHDLVILGIATPSVNPYYINPSGSITCSGKFEITASVNRANRVWFGKTKSILAPINLTITAASFNLNDCDIYGIDFAGAGIPATGTSISDSGNCSNVTFTSPKTVYLTTGSTAWNNNYWANSSGGTPSTDYYPLGQDTVIIDDNTTGTSLTLSNQAAFCYLDASSRTSSFALTGSDNVFMGGNDGGLNLSSSITMSGMGFVFQGTGESNITVPNGSSYIASLNLNKKASGSSVKINNSSSWVNLRLFAGEININSKTLDLSISITIDRTDAKNFAFGTNGAIRITNYVSGNPINNLDLSGLTATTGTGAIYYIGGDGTQSVNFFQITETSQYFPSVYVQANLAAFNLSTSAVESLDFTGATITSLTLSSVSIYGNLTLSSGIGSVVASIYTLSFLSTSGTTRTITTAGKTLDQAITFNGAGGTWQLADNLTLGATRTLTLTRGTLDLNGFTSSSGSFSSNNTNTRTLTFGTGKLSLAAASALTLTSSITLNHSAGASIDFTSASGQTLAGGSTTLPKINLAGAGNVTVTGANTFVDVTNSVQPSSLTLPASTTTTFGEFSLRGTSGNLVVVKSSSTTLKATLTKSSGIVDCNYLNINDNAATGGATWYAGANSTDGLDNTGWLFTNAPVTITLTGNDCNQPNASTSDAINLTLTLTGNDCNQANSTSTGSVSQTHVISANNCNQPNTSNTGAITQAQTLTANDCNQPNTSTTGAIDVERTLTANNCNQPNTTTSGAVSSTIELAANNCNQPNTSTSGAITCVQTLTANNCNQPNVSTTGAITREQLLTGNNCNQPNTSTTGAINKTLSLTGNDCNQPNLSSAGAITREQTLTGNNCDQSNSTSTGAINRTLSLIANDCFQTNLSTTGAIVRTQTLTGNNCQQANQTTSASISQTHLLTGNNCNQVNSSTSSPISQTLFLTGNNSQQNNATTSASITQTHILTGANCQQVNYSTNGQISLFEDLVANNVTQQNIATSGFITQTHILLGNNVNQQNTTTTGSIGGTVTLTANNVTQTNLATSGSINLDLTLVANDCQQANICSSDSISQTHILQANNVRQSNQTTSGSIAQAGDLTGNSVTQHTQSSTGAISQTHILSGNSVNQNNQSNTGAIDIEIVLSGINVLQNNLSTTGTVDQIYVLNGLNCNQNNRSSTGQIVIYGYLLGSNCTQINISTSDRIHAYPVENAPAGSPFNRSRFNPNRPSFINTTRPDTGNTQRPSNTNVIGPN